MTNEGRRTLWRFIVNVVTAAVTALSTVLGYNAM